MKVLKFGGTSLGNARRMQEVAEIVRDSGPVFVVLSAIAGSTDSLMSIVEAKQNGQLERIETELNELREHYRSYVSALFESIDELAEINQYVQDEIDRLANDINEVRLNLLESQVLAYGELLSTYLFSTYLSKVLILDNRLISALDILKLNAKGEPDNRLLEENLDGVFQEQANVNCQLFITQGFICRNAIGEISNLKRGGSDYTASLVGAAINAEEVQIWTDIDGMHNNDPRFVDCTTPVRKLSYNEAAELAYFGAKILHPSSIKPARNKNIPVKLLNTLKPSSQGTHIGVESERAKVKAVAAKDGITAIKIRSSDMLQAQGFLRKVFEIFELYQTSIDMITTSEVSVSLTIDDTQYLEDITKALQTFGHINIEEGYSIISVVGEYLAENHQVTGKVINALNNLPIRMISYGGSPHNISILVEQPLKVDALNRLHKGLFQ